MPNGCNIRFDENDDLVIDDIPDDLMTALHDRAVSENRCVEDITHDLFIEILQRRVDRPMDSLIAHFTPPTR